MPNTDTTAPHVPHPVIASIKISNGCELLSEFLPGSDMSADALANVLAGAVSLAWRYRWNVRVSGDCIRKWAVMHQAMQIAAGV